MTLACLLTPSPPARADVIGDYVTAGTHIIALETVVLDSGVTRVKFDHGGTVGCWGLTHIFASKHNVARHVMYILGCLCAYTD